MRERKIDFALTATLLTAIAIVLIWASVTVYETEIYRPIRDSVDHVDRTYWPVVVRAI